MAKIESPPLEQVVLKAIEVFDRPVCHKNTSCQVIDFTDAFLSPAAFPKSTEQLHHLSLGLFWLLESLGFVREAIGDGKPLLSEEEKNTLIQNHLALAEKELREGGVWGAIYGPLQMIRWKPEDGEMVAIEIENIVLGFVVYLENGLKLDVDFNTVREKMGLPPVEEKIEEEPVVTASEIPKEAPVPPVAAKPKNQPPAIKILGPARARQGERVTLKVKVNEPDGDPVSYLWRQVGGNSVIAPGQTKGPSFQFIVPSDWVNGKVVPLTFEVKVTDQPKGDKEGGPLTTVAGHKMDIQWVSVEGEVKEFAEATGGKQKKIRKFDRPLLDEGKMLNEKPLLEVVKEALTIELKDKEPRKNKYQIMFIIDRSGSMENDIKVVKKNVGEILDHARRQIMPGGEVSVAIRYYVDDIDDDRGEMVPLNGMETIEKEIAEAKAGLNKILSQTDGSKEYHWEAAMHAMDNEPWIPVTTTDVVERVVVLITDEDDGGVRGYNIKKYVKQDAIDTAQKKGIRFEHILLENRSGVGGCFAGSMLLKKADGSLISFDALKALDEAGQPLPQLASFDEEKGKVVYQYPTKLIPHPQWHSTMVYLNGLEVTANHPMLVERGGQNVWLPADEIEIGDSLINPEGEVWTAGPIQKETGIFDVYDISFSADKTGQHPTFLVSPDGAHWFVAHNKVL
ncbi:MAG: hypothetical protein Q7T03_08825 [Deltaproteobacteria bacterium]|nr:hypothetical protein [Deltaproteobacteria bacterium]